MQELSEGDENKKNTLKENMKIPRYIGESSRSAYERGLEHLDKLANLNSKSQMLRHMIEKHEDEDFKDVQWGMFVLDYKRTAFERQIQEAVTIEHVAKKSDILNSKAEWGLNSLPRLVTRISERESEEELKKERKIEEEVEAKIRTLRKHRNKARLQTDRTSVKRQKLDTDSYISIRTVWGPPPITAPIKNKNNTEDTEQVKHSKKNKDRRKTGELSNTRKQSL